MSDAEDRIIEALKRADQSASEPETLQQVVSDMARNQSLYLRVFPWVTMIGAIILAVFVASRFFRSDRPMEWILYATIFICDIIIMAIIKLWLYLCWVRNSLLREIKRVELRLLLNSKQ